MCMCVSNCVHVSSWYVCMCVCVCVLAYAFNPFKKHPEWPGLDKCGLHLTHCLQAAQTASLLCVALIACKQLIFA